MSTSNIKTTKQKEDGILKKMLFEKSNVANYDIDSIREFLNTSHHVLALIGYFDDKSAFKTHYRYNKLSDDNLRYFHLNCCVFNEKYNQQKKNNKIMIKSFSQARNVKVFDFIRLLNNYMATYLLSNNCHKFCDMGVINKSYISKDDLTGTLDDVPFLIKKADDLAKCYGYDNAEQFFYAKIISNENSVELALTD